MLKAILFDLDDTLIDWAYFSQNWEIIEAKHLPGVYAYLETLGDPTHGIETYTREFSKRTRKAWGDARHTLIAPHMGKILVESGVAVGIPEDKIDLTACLQHYNWGKVEGTEVFPDVVEALTLLRERGLKLGLVTNAFQPMWMRDVEMEQHGIRDFFETCRFSAADAGYLKPHPSIFAKALTCLETQPEETIFIGDNPVADIAGAQAAGMRAVMRVNHGRQTLTSGLIIPDATISSLLELPDILEKWYPGWAQS